MIGALLGLIVLTVWLAFCIARSARFSRQVRHREYSRKLLAEFAEHSLTLETVQDVLAAANDLSRQILGAEGLVYIELDDGRWRATRIGGIALPRVPEACSRLFSWFIHNPQVVARSDLGHRRFGAMRALLIELMSLYSIRAVVPLVDRGLLLGAVGVPLARPLVALDRENLQMLLHELTVAVANIHLHHEAVHFVSLSREVDLAASIELAMTPVAMDGENPYVAWAGSYAIAGRAGSDYWGVYPVGRDRVMVVVGDAVGQDLAGTMVAAVVKSACDTIFESKTDDITPGWLLAMLNAALYRPNNFALSSCFAALFDPARSLVHFANAGHEIPYRLATLGGQVQLASLNTTGPLLGSSSDWDFKTRHAPLSPKDSFVFYSNGMVRARNRAGEVFGNRRFQRLLLSAGDHDAGALRDLIGDSVKEFGGGAKPIDDQALVVLRAA